MKNYIDALIERLTDEYGFYICSIAPAKRGFYGETWEIQTEEKIFFVKIDYWKYHKEVFKRSLVVIDYMIRSGIIFCPTIQLTKSGRLYCIFNKGIVSVSEYIEGDNREDYPIEELFMRLADIYKLDKSGVDLETEDFSIHIYEQYQQLSRGSNVSDRITHNLHEKKEIIELYAKRLRLFSNRCKDNMVDFCITHGDAGGNCIISDDSFYIIDWDSVKIAPIERDVWFSINDNQQIVLIQNTLRKKGLNYKLKKEYLCYYCYYSFFLYLTEYLQSYIEAKDNKKKDELEEAVVEYLNNSWIWERLKAADKIVETELYKEA